MWQLDWITGCPNNWLNIISGVPVRLFPGEINIGIWGGSIGIHPPAGQASSNLLRACIEQKCEEGRTRPFLPNWMTWGTALLLSSKLLILRAADPDWSLHHWLHCFLGLSRPSELHHQLFRDCSLQTPGQGTSQPPQLPAPIPLNKSLPV